MEGKQRRAVRNRVLAAVLSAAIVVTSLPGTVFAQTGETQDSTGGAGVNVAAQATASATCDLVNDLGGVKALNDGIEPTASAGITETEPIWHDWGYEGQQGFVQYTWNQKMKLTGTDVYYFTDNGGILIPAESKYEYYDEASAQWVQIATVTDNKLDQYNELTFDAPIVTAQLRITMTPQNYETETNNAVGIREWKVYGAAETEEPGSEQPETEQPGTEEPGTEKPGTVATGPDANGVTVEQITDGYRMSNDYFVVETGKYGNINSLRLKNDLYDTNYVMNPSNAAAQASAAGHQWLGELMFKVKTEGAENWSEENTGRSDSGRKVKLTDNKVVVTYENATEEKGIKSFNLVETYSLTADGKLRWEITVTNTQDKNLIIGDFGVPLAFNEYWPGGEEIYETRTVDHSFVGQDSSYIYITRPSGLGKFLVMTPDVSTGAEFEYQDHWRMEERAEDEISWCQDQAGWANGLNVFYIHSDVIKSTNRGYLENTSLTLAPGEAKTYAFNFSAVADETAMKTTLYNEGIIDAVAVPGMAYSINMPAKLYLHTKLPKDDISFEVKCPHETGLHEGNANTVCKNLECKKNSENTYVNYVETKEVGGEQYHIYNIGFGDLGQNNVIVHYAGGTKETTLQFYMMDEVAKALETHSNFMVDKTQINTPGETGDKVFDDWMMDTKTVRANTDSTYWTKNYWGWGDDWGLTHGEYIAEKNVYQPVAREIEALDQYLDVAIWNNLMREHQVDYLVHDFLCEAPNTSPTYRGYAYPHIYNTYFSMYKIAKKYPDTVDYVESADTYLLRAYNIMCALYSDGVAYNWSTGVMGELTTPDIIRALEDEGYYTQAAKITDIMSKKYDAFKNTKYPYGSEYSYDNTGEEAVYTLAKVNLATDTDNASGMMKKIDAKTRACRGIQPVWYHYADPTTNCGENWWNFQYTASLAGYCMDDWLRLQNNGMTDDEKAEASRVNYAAKLANLTCINSGQIDADAENIGAVAWTYQSEMGNLGGQGTGGGSLHNGWRQMSGEADLGLFGALQILSSDVTVDPVFGLFGYGCNVTETASEYQVTPLDGLFTRLNFINTKLYIELDRDQYTSATVAKDNTSVTLAMKNIEGTAHKTDIEVTGLQAGSYQVMVDTQVVGNIQAVANSTATITVPLPKAATAEVKIVAAAAPENTAPTTDAGADQNVEISAANRLEGTATDDGYVNATLGYTWEVVSAPTDAEAVIATPNKKISDVTFSKTGEYVFKLTADDGQYQTSDTVTITVTEDAAQPEIMAAYSFDDLTADNQYVKTAAGKDYYGTLTYGPKLADGMQDAEGQTTKGVEMTGAVSGGYVEFPHILTKNVANATIAMDVNMTKAQANHTSLINLGEKVVVEFVGGNELSMTVNGHTKATGVKLTTGYWKNIELTASGDDYILYVNGKKIAELADTGLEMKSISADSRYFIGRGAAESGAFLNGIVDNFVMKSTAMTQAELADTYGDDTPRTINETKAVNLVTPVGTKPQLPEVVSALYSDGIYEDVEVEWDSFGDDTYAAAGSFTVNGVVKGTQIEAAASIVVVAGTLQNIAADAAATAIFEDRNDLGGCPGLNDGFEPAASNDTSHGVWHNWGGNNGAPAWVQYTWEEAQVLAGMDVYFFKDGGGNFAPASYTIEYLGVDDNWYPVQNANGEGIAVDQYNNTTFDAVVTTAIRMTMTPATQGNGVIEWKVYGYSEGVVLNKLALNSAIAQANALNSALFASGMENVQVKLEAAQAVAADKGVTQEQIDIACKELNQAIALLVPVIEKNIAYSAAVSTTFVSGWESLGAVNDGVISDKSNTPGIPHYGTWGNESAGETVTYSWGIPMEITSSDVYFWTDGGGIEVPDSYLYEYLDEDGSWKPVENASGYEVLKTRTGDPTEEPNLDGFNTTTFDKVTTTAFRITIHKAERNGNGIGLVEWRVFGATTYVPAPKPEQKPVQLTISSKTVDLYTGLSTQLVVNDAGSDKVVWSTSNAKVATVRDGVVTAVAKGTAKITATAGERSISCDVTVRDYTKVTKIKAEEDSTSIELTWAKVADVTKYEIQRKSGSKWKTIGTAQKNRYTDKKLKSNKNYTYRVRAYKTVAGATTYGAYSSSVKAVTGPAKVTGLKAKKVTKSAYKISWKKVSKATSYAIYKKTGNGSYKKIKTVSAKNTSYTVKKLKAGKTYKFYVKAIRKSGKNSYTGTASSSKTVKIKK